MSYALPDAMNERRYPELFQFFAGYFHEDWPVDAVLVQRERDGRGWVIAIGHWRDGGQAQRASSSCLGARGRATVAPKSCSASSLGPDSSLRCASARARTSLRAEAPRVRG